MTHTTEDKHADLSRLEEYKSPMQIIFWILS